MRVLVEISDTGDGLVQEPHAPWAVLFGFVPIDFEDANANTALRAPKLPRPSGDKSSR